MNKTGSYNIKTIKTPSTYRFELHSKSSTKVLLWYSVPHNLLIEGKQTFVMRVRNYYETKQNLSAEARAKRLLNRVTNTQKEVKQHIEEEYNRDFLDKIARVNFT